MSAKVLPIRHSLALGARAAAARLVRGRGGERARGRGARGQWLPATMRWRWRRHPTATVRGVRAAAPGPATIWAPRFYLHFGAHAGAHRPWPRSAATSLRAATQRSSTTVVHRHSAIVRSAGVALAPRRAHGVERFFAIATGAVGKAPAVGSAPARPLRPAAAPSIGRRAVSRLHQMPLQRPLALARGGTVHGRDRQPAGADARGHARALPLVHRRPVTFAVDAPGRRGDSAPPLSHREHSPELLWRRAARAATPPADDGADSHLPGAAARSAARSLPPHQTPPEPPASISRAAPRQLTQLDPALVDRLADDVIRRIEKRARIERERRGL